MAEATELDCQAIVCHRLVLAESSCCVVPFVRSKNSLSTATYGGTVFDSCVFFISVHFLCQISQDVSPGSLQKQLSLIASGLIVARLVLQTFNVSVLQDFECFVYGQYHATSKF